MRKFIMDRGATQLCLALTSYSRVNSVAQMPEDSAVSIKLAP
jgi:hypothetical protein